MSVCNVGRLKRTARMGRRVFGGRIQYERRLQPDEAVNIARFSPARNSGAAPDSNLGVMKNDELSRRQLLGGAGALSGALLLSRIALADGDEDGGDGNAREGKTAKIADGQLVLRLSDNPELGKVGGWKLVQVGTEQVIVANTDKGIVALSAACPHRGCPVGYNAEAKQFVCPCHNSRFDEDGKVVRGPAKTDLAPYDCEQALIVAAKVAAKKA